MDKKWSNSIVEYKTTNDRIMVVKHSTTCKLNFVQVYAQTSATDETEINNFYNTLTEMLVRVPKSEVTIIQGDLNAKVGVNCAKHNVARKFGLGTCNEAGKKSIKSFARAQVWL